MNEYPINISKQITNSLEAESQKTLGYSQKVSNDNGFQAIPSELKNNIQWVTWILENISVGKTTKRPYIAGLPKYPTNRASVSDPTTWRNFETAWIDISNPIDIPNQAISNQIDISNQKRKGIGYVFSKNDPYCFIDLDKCVDKKTDVIEQWALNIVEKFQSYTEKSQSYDDPEKEKYGLHIICKAEHPEGAGNRKGNFEIYTQGRYCAMTGNVLKGYPVTIEERQEQVNQICSEIFKKPEPEQKPSIREPSTSNLSDSEIINIIRKSKQSAKFSKLFDHGDCSDYLKPDGTADQSSGDMALADILAFYTQDRDQLLSIIKQSALYDDKWEREDYQRRTFEKALSGSGDRYNLGGNHGSIDKSNKVGDPVTEETKVEPVASGDQEAETNSKSKKKKSDSQATILVKLCQLNNVRLWHTKDKLPMATFVTNNHCENWITGSKTFKAYLQRLYYQHYKTAPGKQSVSDAINVIDGIALFDGVEQDVFTRLAYADNKVYLDLANDTWQVIEIDSTGWRVLGNSPIAFRRGRGMLALPTPTVQGNLGALFDIFHVEVKEQFLIMSWLIGAMNQRGPFPILVINGEQGSGKSTLCKLLKNTMDPGIATLKSLPREERDLIISANNSWVHSFDNISGLPDWISDAMCRLSTGGGFSIRELYSDSEEMIFDVKRPIILNGIESMGLRGDFSDRAILVNLPTIESKSRLDEKSMDAKFRELHPTILGGLCDTVSMALKNIDSVKLDVLPRMADFALWITASEPALGVVKLVKLYQDNRDEQSEIVLGASLVGTAIVDFMATRSLWEGTLKQLLDELDTVVDYVKRKEKTYPKDATRLSSKLRRDLPQLRQAGINITFEGHGRTGNLVKIEKS